MRPGQGSARAPGSLRGMRGVDGTKPRDRRRGHGTFPTDRPPVVGRSAGGRARSGWISSSLLTGRHWRRSLRIDDTTLEGTTVFTDEWNEFNVVPRRRKVYVRGNQAGPNEACDG
jgi:hypothetical protein